MALRSEVTPAAAAVVAVKPAVGEEACRALSAVGVGRVLSIMAGVPLARLESWLPASSAVVRAMPNTPATVGAGVSAIAAGSRAQEPDMAWAEEVLGAVGHVVRLPEASLDAVTGLSGSGPAYVFLVVEALMSAGEAVGLAPEVSRLLATDTLAGAARLLVESGETPENLRAAVTSPGGTTEAGLRVLEDGGLRAVVAAAVAAATERSRQWRLDHGWWGPGERFRGSGRPVPATARRHPGDPASGAPDRPGGLSSCFLGLSLSNNHHIGVQSPQAGEG